MVTKTIYPLILLAALQSAACDGTATTARGTQTIPIPTSKPSEAVLVPADFVAMGFDGEFINNYTNSFSANLVESVASRMGTQIKLHIGGTSSDRASYYPKLNSENVAVQCNKTAPHGKSCPNGPGTTFSAGQLYFDAFKAFPNASMTIQAPMSKDPDFDASAQFVKLMYEALGADRCNAIALGNEIENYDGDGGDPSKYIKDAQTLEAKIIDVLGLKGNQTRIFEVLDLGSGSMMAIGNAHNHTGRAVRAPYYAQPFVADFVGSSHSGPSVKEVDLNNPHFTVYAAYEGDSLVRIALVDLLEWSAKNGTRPVRSVSLPVPDGKKVRVAQLEAEAGAWSGGMDYDGKNITYAGQQWSKVDNGMAQPAQQSFETPDVQQGEVTISLKASEAVIVHLD